MTTMTIARPSTVHSPQDTRITHAVVAVTPDMAKRWLNDNNTHNRPISETRVMQHVADMEGGRWRFNGETIQFDRNGTLLNGQHRLTGICRTGLTQTFLVVRGLAPESQITMDQGTRRSPADQLAVAGIITDGTVAAAIRVYIKWETGLLFGDKNRSKVTTSQVVEWAQSNPDMVSQLSELVSAGVKRTPCTPSLALAVALRLTLIDEAATIHFFDKLITRENITGPVLALRNRLDNVRESKVQLTERDLIGFFVIAWNAYRTHRQIGTLRRPKGAVWTPENFPVPR